MKARHFIILCCGALMLMLGGCGEEGQLIKPDSLWGINPLSAEVRAFEDGTLPAGWARCEGRNDCPQPVACGYLDEDQCGARSDCEAVGEAFMACIEATEACEAADCGPQPGMPSYVCADGSPGGPTGRCIRMADSSCAWEIRDCPEPCSDTLPVCDMTCPSGTAHPVDECDRTHTCRCEPEDCSDIPECDLACPQGTHNPTDDRGCVHTCECIPDVTGDCTEEECGPAPMCPAYECWDGSIAGCTGRCYRMDNGDCGWEIRECPSQPPCGDEYGACDAGLVCCYPCGIPDCQWQCQQPCDATDPACVEGCLMVP